MTCPSNHEKKALRKQVRAAKQAIPLNEKIARSRAIFEQVEALPQFMQAHTILLYWSMDDEVATHAFVEKWYRDKTVLLPCVDGDDLVLRQYTGPDCLQAGPQFGIGEPRGPVFSRTDEIAMIVVPGVAFDSRCNRMGRGRGFYDRLLKSTPQAFKVGVAFRFQMFDAIPVEPFDVPMNCVITETD